MDKKEISALINKLIDKKLEPIHTLLEKMKNKMADLTNVESSLEYLHNQYEDIDKQVKQLQSNINKEISKFEAESKALKVEVLKSNTMITQLNEQLDDLEQYSRRDCLEIRGVPFNDGEDTDKIVKEIADLVDVDLDNDDISTSHRLPSKKDSNIPPAIIVKFTKRNIRDEFYQAKNLLRDKSSKDIGMGRHKEHKLFINESLTKYKKDIFNSCLKAKKNLEFMYIWTKYGKTFMRKDKGSRAVAIKSEIDLQRLYFEYGANATSATAS